jgi:hexosaminidase
VQNKHSRKTPFIGIRGIHLDLKGLPPTPERLLELLEIMAGVGINCILVEWEDTYPWKKYPEMQNQTAYPEKTVERFLNKAESLSIEIIPLVQSLGHMENVLSRERFRKLRELDDNVSELCPSKKEGQELVISLVDDILRTHEGRIKHFHLGGDEAWTLGSCPACKKAVRSAGKGSLYLKHILPVLEYLRGKGIQPILWDDMMRNWPARELKKLAGRTDLMVWTYGRKIPEKISDAMVKFSRTGITMWGASAFKGADGVMADVPDINTRKENLLAWIEAGRKTKLKGMVATGWSRYNTFIAPCGSIEESLDALVIAAWSMWDGKIPSDAQEKVRSFLQKGNMKNLAGKRFLECLDSGTKLQEWRNRSLELLKNHWVRSAVLYGEKNRCNPYEEKRIAGEIKESLNKGRKLADNWYRTHKGLIPNVWLKYYIKSRLWQVETYAGGVLEKLSFRERR